jgi:hypothetical protein
MAWGRDTIDQYSLAHSTSVITTVFDRKYSKNVVILWMWAPPVLAQERRFFRIVFNGLSQKRKGLTILSSYQRFDHKTSDRTYQAVAFGDMRRFQLKSNAKGIEMDQFFQVT